MQLPDKKVLWPLPPRQFFFIVGGTVLRPKAYDFYTFGRYIHPAAQLTPGAPLRGNSSAIEALTFAHVMCSFFGDDHFCKQYLPSATARAAKIAKLIDGKGKDGWPETLSEHDITVLKEDIHAFEASLQDDLGKMPGRCRYFAARIRT